MSNLKPFAFPDDNSTGQARKDDSAVLTVGVNAGETGWLYRLQA